MGVLVLRDCAAASATVHVIAMGAASQGDMKELEGYCFSNGFSWPRDVRFRMF